MPIRNVHFATGTIEKLKKDIKVLQMSVTLGVIRVISSVTLSGNVIVWICVR